MKVLLLFIALFTRVDGAWNVRRLDRKLAQSDYEFIISDASPEDNLLCITAVDGMRNFGNLKLEPCDFDNAPPEQLWKIKGFQFYSKLGDGNSKCMVVNHDQSLFDGVRIRLTDCSDEITFNVFTYEGEPREYIRVRSDESYCLTNRGTVAQAGDTIHAKPCRTRVDFRWTLTASDPRDGTLLQFYSPNGGCMQPKNGGTAESTEIILDVCNDSRAWNVKELLMNGTKIFRSRMDTSMCMQAGLGGDVTHGTKMRLMPCKESEELQHFDWEDETPIKLASSDEYCLEWRGDNENVGVDPMIMKTCDGTQYGWSEDAI